MNVYDVMAEACMKVRSLPKSEQNSLFCEYWANPLRVNIVEEYLPYLSKENSGVIYSEFEIDQIKEMWQYVRDREPKCSFYLLVYLDNYIDFNKSFIRYCKFSPKLVQDTCHFSALGQNQAGFLLPKFKPCWEKANQHTNEELNSDPLSIVQNYLWVEKRQGWTVVNLYNDKWNNDRERPFVIACSPLTDKWTFNPRFVESTDGNIFYISEYYEVEQEKILKRTEKILEYSNAKGASVVLLPELLASHKTQKHIGRYLKRHWDYNYPRVVCTPSSGITEAGAKSNRTIVMNSRGETIFQYNKQMAYQHEKDHIKYFESITPDKQLYVLHIKGIGRVAILICADIFSDEIQDILFRGYQVNLLLIMSLTKGTDQFFRAISQSQQVSCDVVWCNSCAAYSQKSKKNKVVAYFANGHENCKMYVKKKCKKKSCVGCVMLITLSQEYNGEGKIEQQYLNIE